MGKALDVENREKKGFIIPRKDIETENDEVYNIWNLILERIKNAMTYSKSSTPFHKKKTASILFGPCKLSKELRMVRFVKVQSCIASGKRHLVSRTIHTTVKIGTGILL